MKNIYKNPELIECKKMVCDICKRELEEEYYHLHQGLCQKCEEKIIKEYYKEDDAIL